MEPRTRTRALTAAAVLLTAGFTAATSLLPSAAHAEARAESGITEPVGGARPAVVQSIPTGVTVDRIGAAMGHTR